MRRSAELARAYGVRLHTHLAETVDEERFCLEAFGMTPLQYAEEVGWLGEDVWFAHGVHVDADGIRRLAATGTGVAHCPTSNMRLASGIAPVAAYLRAGVPVGLGVDGSASNDGGHLLAEARQAMLVARLASADQGDRLMSVRQALELATLGGAAVLGRSDIGSLETGKVADFVALSLDRVEYAGAADPVAAVLLCAPVRVDHTYVGGRPIVVDGRVTTVDTDELIRRHAAAARRLVDGD